METLPTVERKSYVVKIQGFSDEVYKFRCQENTGGQFGNSFELELPAKHFTNMGFDEIKDVIQDYLNGDELYEVKPTENPHTTVSKMVNIGFDTAKLGKYAMFSLGAVAFVFGIILSLSFSGGATEASNMERSDISTRDYKKMSRQEKINYLETKIVEARTERETTYNTCIDTCNADRQTYDGMVTQMLGEQSLEKLGLQEEKFAEEQKAKKKK